MESVVEMKRRLYYTITNVKIIRKQAVGKYDSERSQMQHHRLNHILGYRTFLSIACSNSMWTDRHYFYNKAAQLCSKSETPSWAPSVTHKGAQLLQ